MPPVNQEVEVYDLLYRLGVTANYTGFFHVSYAVILCIERQERLLLVTKWLYPEVARQYGTNWKAVERNIRTGISVIWEHNPVLLERLAGRSLPTKPRNAQFLAILSTSFLKQQGLGESAARAMEDGGGEVGNKPVSSENSMLLAEHVIGGRDNRLPFIAV